MKLVKKIVVAIGAIVLAVSGGLIWWKGTGAKEWLSPLPLTQAEKPLEKYKFARLKQKDYSSGQITVAEGNKFFLTYEGKRVSGQINVPSGNPPAGGWPVVIMLRGYVDKEVYETGLGT
ncbi:MAG: hypothetical protein HY381_00825, partial [Candidatus Chisholmbacteria bacterium]|nr:hypothetical protein [Candidatus Chisholmbacteria bacterium]